MYLLFLFVEMFRVLLYLFFVVVLLIDDLYLFYDGFVVLVYVYFYNGFFKGCGQLGMYDLFFGFVVLNNLWEINDGVVCVVQFLCFEKSLYGGEGDRVEGGLVVCFLLDVVILEGWCVGFYLIVDGEFECCWGCLVLGFGVDFFERCGFWKDDVWEVNGLLRVYLLWWDCLQVFVQVCWCVIVGYFCDCLLFIVYYLGCLD